MLPEHVSPRSPLPADPDRKRLRYEERRRGACLQRDLVIASLLRCPDLQDSEAQ